MIESADDLSPRRTRHARACKVDSGKHAQAFLVGRTLPEIQTAYHTVFGRRHTVSSLERAISLANALLSDPDKDSEPCVLAHEFLRLLETECPAKVYGMDVAFISYSIAHDQYFLVSHDQTTAIPFPRETTGHINDLITPEADRLNCHAGFIPWPPRATVIVQGAR